MIDKKTRLALKKEVHDLKPVVMTGAQGLSDAVQQEIANALETHELIKVRLNAGDKAVRTQMTLDICKHHQAELIDSIGHVIAIYKKSSSIDK